MRAKPVKGAGPGVHLDVEPISHEKHGAGNGSADSAGGAAALPSGPAAICLPGLSPKTKPLHTPHAKKFRVRRGARGEREREREEKEEGGLEKKPHGRREGRWEWGELQINHL